MSNPVAGLAILASGLAAEIRALPVVKDSIDGLDEKRKARLRFIMEKAADHGPERLPPEQFKPEERLSIGDKKGTKVEVYAFKVHQYRVYACQTSYRGKRTLVCTDVDESKKQDKANRSILIRAATRFAPYLT